MNSALKFSYQLYNLQTLSLKILIHSNRLCIPCQTAKLNRPLAISRYA